MTPRYCIQNAEMGLNTGRFYLSTSGDTPKEMLENAKVTVLDEQGEDVMGGDLSFFPSSTIQLRALVMVSEATVGK
jgi:hypothetical protein